jgi:glutaredoxin 3
MDKNTKTLAIAFGGIGLGAWYLSRRKSGSFAKQTKITLYHLDGCPWCALVTDKLEDLGLAWKSKEVSNPKNRKELEKKRNGSTTVPYIVVGDMEMGESADIVDFLEEQFGESE